MIHFPAESHQNVAFSPCRLSAFVCQRTLLSRVPILFTSNGSVVVAFAICPVFLQSWVTLRIEKKFQSTLIFHQTPAYNWKAEAFFRDDDKQFVQKDFEHRTIQHSIRAEMVQAWSGYERRGHSTRCCWWTTQEPAAVVVGSRTKKMENGKSLRKNTSFHCSSLVRNSRKQCSRRRMDD